MQEIGEELGYGTLWSTRLPQQATGEVCVGTLGNADLWIWKAKYPVLTRPLGRGIAETSNSNPARQTTFDGGSDQIGCEKGERDRHIDLADAAFFARSDLLDIGDVAAAISSSQRRPRAIDAISLARVSARIGRRSCGVLEAGTMISRRRFIGVFVHGTRRTSRS